MLSILRSSEVTGRAGIFMSTGSWARVKDEHMDYGKDAGAGRK